MKKSFENIYHRLEDTHWWFITRRSLVRGLISRSIPNHEASILEIGCSSGPLIKELQAHGYKKITGIDISEDAIKNCRKANLHNTHVMDAQSPEFPDDSFDVIIASDVLEHLSNAEVAIRAWRKLLRSNGILIIFVPAFMTLWSNHDVVNKHFHRYTVNELTALLVKSQFKIQRAGYWNFFLFLPISVLRVVRRCLPASPDKHTNGDLKPLPNYLNQMLTILLSVENKLILAGMNFPWGISAMAISIKSNTDESH